MATWSGMRKKLEQDYLAESLRGHISYYCTSYSKSDDRHGDAAILLDGKELVRGNYWNNYFKVAAFPKDETYEKRMTEVFAYMDETALRLGIFDNDCFYNAFAEFDNQSIEKSLMSEDIIVRIFAVLDRRVGKRRLLAMKDSLDPKNEIWNLFYMIRMQAENLSLI